MKTFSLIVKGLWFGLVFFTLAFIGESIFPGSLKETAFSTFGLVSIFCLVITDTIFSLGSAEDS